MISKKSLILNLSFIILATIILVVAIIFDLSSTVKYLLIGTLFMISAMLSIFNSFTKKKH